MNCGSAIQPRGCPTSVSMKFPIYWQQHASLRCLLRATIHSLTAPWMSLIHIPIRVDWTCFRAKVQSNIYIYGARRCIKKHKTIHIFRNSVIRAKDIFYSAKWPKKQQISVKTPNQTNKKKSNRLCMTIKQKLPQNLKSNVMFHCSMVWDRQKLSIFFLFHSFPPNLFLLQIA